MDNHPPIVTSNRPKQTSWGITAIVTTAIVLLLLGLLTNFLHHRGHTVAAITKPVLGQQDKMGKVGQPVTIGASSLTVNKVQVLNISAPSKQPGDNNSAAPQVAAGTYLDVTVTIKAVSAQTGNFSLQQFSAWSKNQQEPALGTHNLPPNIAEPLATGGIKSGESITGEVVLPIVGEAKQAYVVWEPTASSPKLYVPVQ